MPKKKHKFLSMIYGRSMLLCSLLLSTGSLYAQEIGLKVDFFGYADNREFSAPHTRNKTIFGTLTSPSLYFALDSSSRLYGGVHYNQDFGVHPKNKSKINPIAYYNYKTQHIDFAIGFIPRYPRLKDVPRVVLADTFMYDRPNIEGMYFEYKNKHLRQRIFIDWLSKKSEQHREQFIAGLSGHASWGLLFVAHSGILFHNALTSTPDSAAHIQDNAVLNAKIGLNLSRKTFLDSLSIDVGGVLGFDRLRSVYPMRKKAGFMSTMYLGLKQFSVVNTLYLGQAQALPNGDAFYARNRYNRLDLGWTPFRTRILEARLVASFHFSKGFVDNQQAFTLRYHFGSPVTRSARSYSRGER
ncbi:hypothetical protein [Sphingobacterium kitahiroshimense]|uniref:Lipid A deacylase LpxR family protein n=1 Tax=Sphingobacterium kitahiroshimense TaxID=470446 RepID=A0ABV0BWI1_9SPHI